MDTAIIKGNVSNMTIAGQLVGMLHVKCFMQQLAPKQYTCWKEILIVIQYFRAIKIWSCIMNRLQSTLVCT